ncbi:MAG: hypothetical protein ABIL06_13270 [Pseudomonadota bacterium]|uniref:Uncharacterized protein n=1 Tax=viral metagenome TaxID=1070528 RepID=A0A6H1ZH67_9ZZZZ
MLRSDLVVDLEPHLMVDYDDDDGIDCDQTAADVARFLIKQKCEVVRSCAIVTEVCAGTITPIVDFDLRPTVGSDTDRGVADIGHLILSTTAAGKVMFDEVGQGTVLEPGEEVVVQLITAASGVGPTGHFIPYLQVKIIPETQANLDDTTETA